MDSKTLYRISVLDVLGFEPTSNAIKPVHVANGLARSISGQYGDVAPLHEVVRVRMTGGKQPRPPWTTEELQLLAAFQGCDAEIIDDIRHGLNEVVNADHGVHSSPNFSSYTLSHELFCTSDSHDQGLGDLLWHLLSADVGDHAAALHAVEAIVGRSIHDGPRDDLTTLVAPLLQPKRFHRNRRETLPLALTNVDSKLPPSYVLGHVRNALDLLATREANSPPLLLLRRLILMGCLGVHVHMVQWEAEINAEYSAPDSFCPLLLDLTGDNRSNVAESSRDSLQLAMNFVDDLARYLVREGLQRTWPGRNLDDGRVLRGIRDELDDEKAWEQYEELRGQGYGALDALALAVFETGAGQYSAPPQEFARYLAQRSGFVGPRRSRGRKGYRISLELLEILTLGTVPEGDVWTVQELLSSWWERFGIVVGGRDDDHDVLSENGIDRLTHDDLDQNTDRLVELLEEQGLARRYGDGVRQVGQF